jgi:hypothetical protein
MTSVVPPAPIDVQPDKPPVDDWLLWHDAKITAEAITASAVFTYVRIRPPNQ